MKEPEPRCPYDNRGFTQEEIDVGNRTFKRKCALKCGKFMYSSESLELFCGCHYCIDCAIQEAENSGKYTKCVICKAELPAKTQETLLKFVKEVPFDPYKEAVSVFSQAKFSTELLTREKADLPVVTTAASIIAAKFPRLRKVSWQNNEGFWTAVGLAYLEHIFLHIGDADSDSFGYLLLDNGIAGDDPIFGYLKLLANRRASGHAGDLIDSWFGNYSFQIDLVRVVKSLTIAYVRKHPDQLPSSSSFKGNIEDLEAEIIAKQEVSESVMEVVALALPIRLIVYVMKGELLRKTYGCNPTYAKLAKIHILQQDQVYSILYSTAFLKVEGYPEANRIKSPFAPSTLALLYYTPKPLAIPPADKEYSQIREDFSHKAKLFGCIESLIITLFEALKTKPLPAAVHFFTPTLCSDASNLHRVYQALLPALRSLPEDELKEIEPLYALEKWKGLEDLSVLQLCGKCKMRMGDAKLECGHYICQSCFITKAEEVKAQKGYILDRAGEAVDGLGCPVTQCELHDKVSRQSLQILLGDQLEAYQWEAERGNGTRKCKRCAKVYAHDCFLQFSICNCRLCLYCQAEMLKSGNRICLCGASFVQSTIDIVRSRDQICIVCSKTSKLMRAFTSVRCSEHIICSKCMECIMKDPEPCCPVDHRKFSQEEIDIAGERVERECGLHCGRLLSASEALALDCDCSYCEKCALEEMKRQPVPMQNTHQCVLCGTPYPQLLRDKFTDILKQADFLQYTIKVIIRNMGSYKAPKCFICLSYIGKGQIITLACHHSFHKECIRDQAECHTDAIIRTELQCLSCQAPIDGYILQKLMNPATFHKYNVKLIEATVKMVYCPNCEHGHIADAAMFLQEAPGRCQHCGFLFCAWCEEQWGLTHDTKRCLYEHRQMEIMNLEQVMGPNEAIAQCPTCKAPHLKDKFRGRLSSCECEEWNFCCSSLRQPVLAHGNHWHRPDCKHWAAETVRREKRRDCPECNRQGRCCRTPLKLRVPRRFDFDEY